MDKLISVQDFAALIRERRQASGISQAQLAAQVGVSRQWLIDIEKGKPRAELYKILAVLQALNVQLHVTGAATSKKAPAASGIEGEQKIRDLAQAFDFLLTK